MTRKATFHDALALVRWQFLRLGILGDFADDYECSRVITRHAIVWYDETPGEMFRAALVKAGILEQVA